VEQRDSDRAQRDAVLDGSRAPKLTGRNRQMKVRCAAMMYCPSIEFSSMCLKLISPIIPFVTPYLALQLNLCPQSVLFFPLNFLCSPFLSSANNML
jgi:hypothetical protein